MVRLQLSIDRAAFSFVSEPIRMHSPFNLPRSLFPLLAALSACVGAKGPSAGTSRRDSTRVDDGLEVPAHAAMSVLPDTNSTEYEGTGPHGIPHYAINYPFSSEDRELLRRAYGIADPHRLYLSDSTDDAILKYDTSVKRRLGCIVNSYRVGFVSVRRPGETWEEAERRVKRTPALEFTGHPHPASVAISYLDPEVRPEFERMLAAARARGFVLRVTATYRSPVREAFLMSEGGGRTHTLTSSHSYGRAIDVVVDDGNRSRSGTKADWIAFRRWVSHYSTTAGERFRTLGQAGETWDWPHVELPTERVGFRSIEDAIARARTCLAPGATLPCNFRPHRWGDPLVF